MMQPTKVALASLSMIVFTGVLAGQTQGRLITIPATITEPGLYQLRLDSYFSAGSATAIRIQASGVTLDLGGGQIVGPGMNSGIGVEVVGASGVIIRNGNIADFAVGVRVADSRNVTVTGLNIRARDLTIGAPPETGVMIVQSVGVSVKDNNITNVGLGVFVRGGQTRGNTISNNTITAGMNGVIGICYNPTPTDPRSPSYDAIENNLIAAFRTGIQFASSSGPSLTRRNVIFHRGSTAIEINETGSLDQENVKVRVQ